MHCIKNKAIAGSNGKPIAIDIFYNDGPPKPVVIYAHGFNGFKDWGSFDIIAKQFAEAGFTFIKFNFSHNGTSIQSPEEFVDPEAYGHNNYTKELFDLQQVIDWALNEHNPHANTIDTSRLYLIGHSRGGGIVLVTTAEDNRVKAAATWASVAQCKTPWGAWDEERIRRWKESGVDYYINKRTAQQLPLYYQLHEDYQMNSKRLDIILAVKKITAPLLICHGTEDEAVPVSNAYAIKEAAPGAELFLVESDHVFARKHPWMEEGLPLAMQAVVTKTIDFFLAQ